MTGTASAAAYYLEAVYNAKSVDGALSDKHLRLYDNAQDAKEHHGWCYVPGDRAHRGSSWSCTVVGRSGTYNGSFGTVRLRHYSDGQSWTANGKTSRIYKTAQYKGQRPYCLYLGILKPGAGPNYTVYLCAYWV
ncbi:hypothetical protein [Lentzea sp. HUAS12]|uniref:hypothetical protein n=1 Tax=Lentzea sp. HUAS12 TaxID=2951806 RepID=UPI0020A0022A|nr:hypothetical protein [Lentzea sp. HUAS12]USX56326.1 hypothetical protein ND450_20165 [Lentzea sp. HUAS12]